LETQELALDYAILAPLDHVQFRKSRIFMAILGGQLEKCAVFGCFSHLLVAG
jgi:hypothetical protein